MSPSQLAVTHSGWPSTLNYRKKSLFEKKMALSLFERNVGVLTVSMIPESPEQMAH